MDTSLLDSRFEIALADYIQECESEGSSPLDNIDTFKESANELLAVAQEPIPCWQKQDIIKENGLFKVKNGTALVHDGYFVMLEDLVERLPRMVDEI